MPSASDFACDMPQLCCISSPAKGLCANIFRIELDVNGVCWSAICHSQTGSGTLTPRNLYRLESDMRHCAHGAGWKFDDISHLSPISSNPMIVQPPQWTTMSQMHAGLPLNSKHPRTSNCDCQILSHFLKRSSQPSPGHRRPTQPSDQCREVASPGQHLVIAIVALATSVRVPAHALSHDSFRTIHC